MKYNNVEIKFLLMTKNCSNRRLTHICDRMDFLSSFVISKEYEILCILGIKFVTKNSFKIF